VLAAIFAVVARRVCYRELVVPIVSSNRFERHLATYVGPLAQGAVATVGVAGRSFDELVRHTWTTVLEASRLARYDTARRDAMNERIEHERGLHLNLDPFFNSLVPESVGAHHRSQFSPPETTALADRLRGARPWRDRSVQP
jgi:hypothetical protein